MQKYNTIMLDTNVLIHNPQVLYDFKNSECETIALSSITIEELDSLKKEAGEKGRSAREAAREILKIVQNDNKINCFQKLKIENPPNRQGSADDKIIDTFLNLMGSALLLTLDNIMYIKAKLKADANHFVELFDASKTTKHNSDGYTGRITLWCSSDKISNFYNNGYLAVEEMYADSDNEDGYITVKKDDLTINQFVTLISQENPSESALGVFDGNVIRKLRYNEQHPYSVTPKNAGQVFFQEALMESADKVPLVICQGPAGTAKTFYSLAVGLENMMSVKTPPYRKILCCRPNVQMDEDLGFLPGDEKDKIAPYFRPIIDNLENFLPQTKGATKVEDIIHCANINFEAVAFMRGRSIVDTYLIVDEAQNLTITQVKGIITRAGKGTKVILLGDPEQIDSPYLDRVNNGLSYAATKMKGSPLCFQLTMSDVEGVRSKLATEAAQRL